MEDSSLSLPTNNSKIAIAYGNRYAVNYYRKAVIGLILQQCRISKVSSAALNSLSSLLELVIIHAWKIILRARQPHSQLLLHSNAAYLLRNLSRAFMSTTPVDFTLQQYIDYLLNHNRITNPETLAALFGGSRHRPPPLLPVPNSEICEG